jgi:prepilin-type N-terminal cleavage/methylation domain-containing protein
MKPNEDGFTLVELLTSMIIFGIILVITSGIIFIYLQQVDTSNASANTQNNAQAAADELNDLITSAQPCPGSTAAVSSAPTTITSGAGSLIFSAQIPGVVTSSSSSTSNVEIITVSASSGALTATTSTCSGYSGSTRELIDASMFSSASFSYILLPATTTSYPYPSVTSPNISQMASIIGINVSMVFKANNGPPITINTSDYFESTTCNQTNQSSSTIGVCQ